MDYEWRPVVGYEGIYEVRQGTDGGRVRRVVPIKRSRVGKELGAGKPDCFGYPVVMLSRPNEKPKKWRLHEVILLAFVGPKPTPKHIGRHKDDVKTNNVIGNLVWGTKAQNNQDAWDNGLPRARGARWNNHPPVVPSWISRRKL
ncbi:HNH endonuclease protein [Rhizobium phage RHph_I4]|nr:HNH endonuclease protein [Rhizobium phage RHph_I4]